MATYVFQSSMDLKVRVVHKTYREHYMLFQGYIPNSLSELVVETRKLMVRSDSPILDQFDESYTAGGWTGRISWIGKKNGVYGAYISTLAFQLVSLFSLFAKQIRKGMRYCWWMMPISIATNVR